MNHRFLIGQYGQFDYSKYDRDYRADFYGIEACLFRNEQDISNLLKESRDAGFRIGIHFPLRSGISPLRDALFLAKDAAVRSEAYSLVLQELDYIRSFLKPDYILFHYPKPVILDERANWTSWRFDDQAEYDFESEYSFEEFKKHSDALFEWLAHRGEEYGFTPVLEFDALNRYVYEDDYLRSRLEKYSSIKLCLDTARLYIQDRIDPHFDAAAILRQYARYAATVHLSNILITDGLIAQSRMPVLPGQSPSEGWAPIELYLRIILRENPDVKIMFEHRSEKVTDDQLEQCYRWVSRILEDTNTNL
ncbi:sugar phosphate isomerase/epimerase [Paenibacillus glycanilyticus]|uniref:sugar phosphate isomerase/epimerase n=1 Tax=Paenibacillus glycanilyticus TaxID=126569 RepID=UPI002040DBE8|nr:sugar phosphate isomerase/epimerase [Paenibacillus glycanilyticus]MCM3631173.1 sugar phosphate isomerase/epimerase [Paenibacillus glycanilyticus]